MENLLPWQSQLMVPSETLATRQPWWVQTAEKALNSPSVGWVTTTFSSVKIDPPPTSIWEVGTGKSDPEAEPDPESVPELGSLPQAASSGAPIPAAAKPASVRRLQLKSLIEDDTTDGA